MKFKEFVNWANERASDGMWNWETALVCTDIVQRVRKNPFWKREGAWQEINSEWNVEDVIVRETDNIRLDTLKRRAVNADGEKQGYNT